MANSIANRVDPAALMRISSLEMRARTIVEGFMQGLHRSPYHGSSIEFSEYREYVPGDDTRYMDWKLYARTDRYCIKKFETETNLFCHHLVDLSRSMSFGSLDYTKADYAVTLAATFTQFLFQQGDAVGLVTFDDKIREYIPSQSRQDQLRTVIAALEKKADGEATGLKESFESMAPLLRKRGLVCVFSDMLAPLDGLESQLGYLRSVGHEVVIFVLLDPAELDLDQTKPQQFRDLETGKIIYIDPAFANDGYREKLHAHLDQVKSYCRGLGIDYILTKTDSPFDLPLRELLGKRSKVRQSRRQRA